MVILNGYLHPQLVRESSTSVIYRAQRTQDHVSIIAKLTRGEYPTSVELARLRHEYELLRSFDLPSVLRAEALEPCGHGLALILEDIGERSVRTLIDDGPRALRTSLQVAIALVTAVEAVHRHRVVHKDLKPDHFMLRESDRLITLIDFGIATRLSLETPAAADAFEGTLAYMSPEQTGRMNRAVDRRSDLYSVGVVLYELLTGVLPFTASDPLELVHCHTVRTPRPAHQIATDLPLVLSDVVMKLLAKAAEDRYQDAGGLRLDLETCLTLLDSRGAIASFELGRTDLSDELRIPQKLYGREKQLAALNATFERVRSGAVELLLVRGGSGTGKSALVHELNRVLVRQGRVVSGKFDQLSRNLPYAPIVHGCRGLLRSVLAQPPERLAVWRQKLEEALGPNGRLILDLVPELEAVIGPQRAATEVGPAEAQRRFESTFERFLQVFASADHPLVFFLDDVQWADPASLRLLHLLLTRAGASHLLLIGAFRDSAVGPLHPLSLAIADMRNAGATVGEIDVAPLDRATIDQLLADTLHSTVSAVERLSEITHKKTHGNPFFVGQFLSELQRKGLLRFDGDAHRWRWDANAILASTVVTDNVVDLMVARFLQLSTRARDLLERAACLGYEFDRHTLLVIAENTADDVTSSLWEALSLGLIVPLDGNYRFAPASAGSGAAAGTNARYRFLHDRVRQTAYAFIDEADKQALHLRIGRRLLAAADDEPMGEDLFAIVDHLNVGAPLMGDQVERQRLARLDLRAGCRAKDAAAHDAAAGLFGHCLTLLGDARWATDYEIAFPAQLALAECEFLGGRMNEAMTLLDVLAREARTPLDRAAVGSHKVIMLSSMNRMVDAIACGVEALALLGVELPLDAAILAPAIGSELAAVTTALAGREPAALLDLPMMSNPEQLAVIDLLFQITPAAVQANQALMAVAVLRAVRLMLQHGNSTSAPQIYCAFGLVYGGATGDRQTAFRFAQLGIALSERLEAGGGSGASSVTRFIFASCFLSWWRPIGESLEQFELGMKAGRESGDLVHVGYCAVVALHFRFLRGDNLDDLGEHALSVAAMFERSKSATHAMYAALVLRAIGDCRGRLDDRQRVESGSLSDAELERQIGGNQSARGTNHVLRAACLFMRGDYRKSLEEAGAAVPFMPYFASQLSAVEHVFYRSLAAAGVLRSSSCGETERAALLETLREDEAMLRGWATDCPYNYAHRHALVAAELAAASGAFDTAMDLYERAITEAAAHGFVHHVALANELYGLFHLGRGRAKVGRLHLVEAREVYLHWGGTAIADALATRHPVILETIAASATARNNGETSHTSHDSRGTIAGGFDLLAAIRASQAIASELDPARLVERVLRTLIANAGAQRGILIAVRGERLEITAMVTIEPDVVRLGLAEDVHASEELAASVVQYVARTGEIVVLGEATTDARFGDDPHVTRTRARSLLCLPMSHQGRVAGILYLGNDITTHAFSPQRVELLQFLAAQATVAMENATLYGALHAANETLEERVAERTRELADSREQHRVLLETTEAIPWEMEPGTVRFSYVGPQAIKILGYPAHEWTREGFLAERLHVDSRAAVLERLGKCAERDGHDKIDLCMVAADGHLVWLRTLVTTTHEATGERLDRRTGRHGVAPPRAVQRGILLDVTEQRRLELELRAAQKLESVGRLAAGIAHEVNTPVQFVSDSVHFVSNGFADLTRLLTAYQSLTCYSAGNGEPDFATRVAVIRALEEEVDLEYLLANVPPAIQLSLDGLSHIATIVRSMKMFSHPDQQEKSPADLNANIQSTLVIAATEYRQVATLHTEFGKLTPVLCHAGEINQVILNLIVNAAHAVADAVSATHGIGSITVKTWQEGEDVVVSVADTGGGIPDHVRDRIFDPFFTTKEVGRGTGQGLSIARGVVVDKHGGQISFETTLGRGTTFFVRLPIAGARRAVANIIGN